MTLIPSTRRIVTTDAAGNLPALVLDKLPASGGGEAGPLEAFSTLPSNPTTWQPYQYRVTSATVLPGEIEWATGAPVVGDWGIVVLIWDGTAWRGEWAEMSATPPVAPPETVPPTPGTLAASAITHTGFTLTVSGASDETALHASPYRFSTDDGSSYSAWQTSVSYPVSGLTPETGYTCRHQVRDAAGNIATGVAIVATTGAAPATLDPATIPDLVGWFDATDAATLTMDGASVTQWADKSPTAALPTRAADGGATMTTMGGLAAVQFAQSKPMQYTWGSPVGQAPLSVFVVARLTSAPQGKYIISAGRARIGATVANGNVWRSFHGQTTDMIDFGAQDTAAHTFSQCTDGAVFSLRVDDALAPATPAWGATNPLPSVLELAPDAACVIGEVIVVKRDVGAAERDQIHAYLAGKWGIT